MSGRIGALVKGMVSPRKNWQRASRVISAGIRKLGLWALPIVEEHSTTEIESTGNLNQHLTLYREGRTVAWIFPFVEPRGISVYACAEGLKAKEPKKGYGTMVVKRGFALALEEAKKKGWQPKWAYVYYVLGAHESHDLAQPHKELLESLGFTSVVDEATKKDPAYADLEYLINRFPSGDYYRSNGRYGFWFIKLEELLGK